MKKTAFLALLAGLLLGINVQARPFGRNGIPVDPDTVSTIDGSSARISDEARYGSASSGVDCTLEKSENYVSLEFLKAISYYPSKIRIYKSGDTQGKIILPKYVKACVDLQFEPAVSGNHLFLRAKNTYNYAADGIADNLTMEEKFFKCMQKKGYTKDDNIDFSKLDANAHDVNFASEIPFDAPIKGDKSYNIAFGSSKISDFGHKYPIDGLTASPGNWQCMVYEHPHGKPYRFFTSEEDRAASRVVKACESRDYEEILGELARLKDSSLGNAKVLVEILENALEVAREKEAKDIYAKLDEIEKEYRSAGDDISEEDAEELGKKYVDQLRKLNEVVLTPSIHRLNDLIEMRNDVNKDEIDKKIKNINGVIGEFAKRGQRGTDRMRMVFEGLKKHGLTDLAHDIELIRLTSLNYSRVYKGRKDKRGPQLTLSKAKSAVDSGIKKFETTVLDHWEQDYATRTGSKAPITRTQREIAARKQRMQQTQQNFFQNEQKQQQKYCGRTFFGSVNNPVRCRSFMQGRDRRMSMFLNRRKQDLLFLRDRSVRLDSYSTNYENWMSSRPLDTGFGTDLMGDYHSWDYNYSLYGDSLYMGNGSDVMFQMGTQPAFNMGRSPSSGNPFTSPIQNQGQQFQTPYYFGNQPTFMGPGQMR